VGGDSVVGIDLLRVGRFGDRMGGGSTSIQTVPGVCPASCTVGTRSFPGLKRPRRAVDHAPPSSADIKERVEVYLYSPSGISCPFIGRTLPL
jgi:hypothetical protein